MWRLGDGSKSTSATSSGASSPRHRRGRSAWPSVVTLLSYPGASVGTAGAGMPMKNSRGGSGSTGIEGGLSSATDHGNGSSRICGTAAAGQIGSNMDLRACDNIIYPRAWVCGMWMSCPTMYRACATSGYASSYFPMCPGPTEAPVIVRATRVLAHARASLHTMALTCADVST